jgi:hypothetical protein
MAVALLPGENAGKICTVSSGVVSLRATFSGAPGETVPPPDLPDPGPNVVVCDPLHEEGSAEERRLSCEVRSVRPGDLAAATDELLRALSAHAALAGAVFEARVVRLAEPLVPDALLVGELARDLSSSGIGVSFGPSSVPAPYGAAICVGASGRERRIERFLREHPAWQPIPL